MVKFFIKNNPPKRNFNKYRSPAVFNAQKPKKRKISIKAIPWVKVKIIFACAVFLFLGFYLLFSNTFKIKDIIVEGNTFLPQEEIVKYVSSGQNIFLFKSAQTKKNLLQAYPEIKELEILRGIPNAIKIVVLERDGKIVWQSGENRYFISSEGEVSHRVTGEEGKDLPLVVDQKSLPVVEGRQIVSPNFIAFVLNIDKSLKNDLNLKALRYEIMETTFDVNAYTDSNFFIKFNSLRSSKKQIESLKTVLLSKRSEIREYVDIRIDGWAYYK